MATDQTAEEDDRVYVDLVRPSEEGGAAGSAPAASASVTFRRTKGRDSLKRLSDILSAYIPVRGAQDNHHQPLLEETSEAAGSPPLSPGSPRGPGYRTLMLLDVAGLRLTEPASSRENLLLPDGEAEADGEGSATATATATAASGEADAADGDISGVALSKSGYAFLTFKDSPNILRLEVQPSRPAETAAASKATCRVMQVKLRGDVALIPTAIKVHEERLFICGHLSRESDGGRVALSVMVRCSLDCQVELASKELPRPRFFGFDVDPTDGHVVVASPTPDGRSAQIFKMSGDFKRKLFKIQLGSRNSSWNRPEFVACVGGQCWVAAEQAGSQSALNSGQVKHRLLSFPLRPPQPQLQPQEEAPPASTKSWMKVSSWKFEGIKPWRLMSVPGCAEGQQDRLLMLSRDQGNIYCVSEKLGCTALTHPASEGGQAFTAICCLQEPCQRPGALAIDILAATKDSLYLLQAS